MTDHSTITCDGCGGDLTDTSNSVGWRLTLRVDRMPIRPGAVTDMMIYPPLDGSRHFCTLPCLDRWRIEKP